MQERCVTGIHDHARALHVKNINLSVVLISFAFGKIIGTPFAMARRDVHGPASPNYIYP
jgi:hypothetical protein